MTPPTTTVSVGDPLADAMADAMADRILIVDAERVVKVRRDPRGPDQAPDTPAADKVEP